MAAVQQNISDPKSESLPDFFGQKQQTILLRSGLELILGDFHLKKRRNFHFYSSENVCEFAFVLSGKLKNRLHGLEDIEIMPLFSALWLTPVLEGQHDCFPDSNIKFVCVRISRSLLSEIAGEFLSQAPEDFRLILEKRQNRLFYRFSTMTIPMQAAAQQIFQCPYYGAMKKLFLESKALELISHFMVHLFGDNIKNNDHFPEKEKKRIELARDILIENMETPLSLPDLAVKAGISETKLTRGFRKLYDTSVFAYLRKYRMDKALMLLESGNMNVTEVAYAVGYSSPSHFTRVFTKYFGSPPRKYLFGFHQHL